MELHLLGTVEATLNGRPIPLGATKQRAVLVMLALQANATVSVDRLVDGLWGEVPPATAPKMVQLYVSQLRRLLGGDGAQIVTHGRGYELRVPPEAIDAARFERLVDEAGRSTRAPNDAAREALALWHGAALADVAGEPFAAAEIRRLDELWLRAAELAVEGDLAAGRDEDALAQLERLVEEHPLRERLHAQRMLALYRSGRQADALEAYAAARRRLVDEVGVEPSAELRELQARILRQDPSLRLPSAPVEAQPAEREAVPGATKSPARGARAQPVGSSHRRLLVTAATAALLVGIAVFAVTRLTGADPLRGIHGGAVGVIDPGAAAVTAEYRTGSDPGAVAKGAGSVWVASPSEGTVSRIHRQTDRLETIDVGPAPAGLAFGGGSLWVAGGDDGAVAQVDPGANRVLQRIPIGNGLRAVAVGYGALWAATALDGEVVRIDLRSGHITRRIAVGGQPAALATGAGSVWAAAEESGTIARIDPRSGDVLDAIPVGNGPAAVAVGLGAVWVANRQDGTVSRIDPATDRVTETVPAGRSPVALTIADHALWVADASGAVLRLDPRTRTIVDTVRTGSTPAGLAAVGGSIWVTAVAPPAAHRGGTLRVGGSIVVDPAFGEPDAPAIDLAYDGLLAYRRQGGAAGARLVGGLAAEVPRPADGGRRYVFRLRRGLRYSDGTPVRAGDFRASVERAAELLRAPGVPFPDAIRGMSRCRKSRRGCDLSSGIVADDGAATITIHLRRADPELLEKLAAPLLAVLPPTTPRRLLSRRAPVGTGPYRVARLVPGRRVLLTRNPHFRPRGADDRPAGFADRVEVSVGGERAQIAAAERGRLDLASVFETTLKQLAALRTQLGSRVRSAPAAFTEYAWLNVKAPPFDDPRVRRALNLAVDRARVVDLTGGPDAGSPACQLLPPGLPGYRPICPFTVEPSPAGAWVAPDRAQARRLVAASGTRGTAVEVWGWAPRRGVARHLADVLRELGFRSRLRVFGDLGQIIDAARDPRQRPQIGVDGWIADYPDPAAFLNALISCHGYVSDSGSPNLSRFCDRSIDAEIERARAAGPDAGAAWQRIERRIAKHAPVVPLTTRRSVMVTSRRAGNVQFGPGGDLLLDQVWVR
jgi:YVTN family beta-propeller protein